MKKLTLLTTIGLCATQLIQAQFLPGIRTSDYNGVLGTFTNPANTVGSQYKWDMHLFGMSMTAANADAKIKWKNDGDGSFLRNKVLGKEGLRSGLANVDIPLLALMVDIGKKNSLAFTSRGRIFINATDLDARLINEIVEGANDYNKYPFILPAASTSVVNASMITDYGFTYGRELLSKGSNYLKVGVTAKYVSGVGNLHFATNLNGKIDLDLNDEGGPYISPGAGSIGLRNGGSAFADDFKANQLIEFNGGGLGFDLRLTYEYRPENWKNASTKKEIGAHGHIPYLFKLGVSLVDIGKVKFNPDIENSQSYRMNIPDNKRFYLTAFDNTKVSTISETLDEYPQFFTKTTHATNQYKVSLPTTLLLNFDYNICKGFFVNAEGRIGLKKENTEGVIKTYNSFSITPRFDGKQFGVFLPISMHQLSGVSVGAAVHLGPLYIGSGSILSVLMGGSKQIDGFFGLRFGGLKAKKEAIASNKSN
jgi:hypothetical protein